MQELLSTATIGRTHGVEGFLKIYSLSGEYAHLKKLKSAVAVFPDGKEKLLSVSQVRFQGDLLLMKFSGYETPESARLLSGAILKVKREDARKLRKGEYYIADLLGMEVFTEDGHFDVVRDVMETGANEVYIVESDEHGEVLIPAIRQCVLDVNVEEKKMKIRLLDGLIG